MSNRRFQVSRALSRWIGASFCWILLLVSGCGDPVKTDLETMRDTVMKKLEADQKGVQERIKGTLEQWKARQINTVALVKMFNEDAIPAVKKMVEAVDGYRATTPEVRKVKGQLVEVMEKFVAILDELSTALQHSDEKLARGAGERMRVIDGELNSVRDAFQKLCEEHQVAH
jgi:hypothetical protein